MEDDEIRGDCLLRHGVSRILVSLAADRFTTAGGLLRNRGIAAQPRDCCATAGLLRNRGYFAWVSRIFAAKTEKTPAKV